MVKKEKKLSQEVLWKELKKVESNEVSGGASAIQEPLAPVSQERKNRDATARGREDRKRYEKTKKMVFEMEKTNRSLLITFRSTHGWWKIGGVSALIYVYRIAPRLKIKPNLRIDTDRYSTFRDGIVSIQSLDILERNLATIRIRADERAEDYVCFKLDFSITDDDLRRMRATERMNKEKINKIVLPKAVMPDMRVTLLEMNKIAFENTKKADAVAREYISMDVARIVRNMELLFLKMCNGRIERKDGLLRLNSRVHDLLELALIMSEYNIWENKPLIRLCERAVKLKGLITEELNKNE